jgi:hypothetical protein
MTEAEREYLLGEQGDQRMYEAKSRVRSRIEGPLKDDLRLLAEHQPDLLKELQETVCEETDG